MIRVHFILHGRLAVLANRHGESLSYDTEITLLSSLFDAVQAQGIAHVAVSRLSLNGAEAEWNDHLQNGDHVEVYPFLPSKGETPLDSPALPAPPAFLLDVHLGRLAAYMRLLGFDTAYHSSDIGDSQLVQQAVTEKRILLTCDRHLLMHRALQWGYLLQSRISKQQMFEILEFFDIRKDTKPFTRCMACNGLLRETSVGEIREQAPPLVRLRNGLSPENYSTCSVCGKLYWPGTHSARMERLLIQWGLDSRKE